MFEPESNPEQQEAPEESQQSRINMDVTQCLVVNFCYLNITLHVTAD